MVRAHLLWRVANGRDGTEVVRVLLRQLLEAAHKVWLWINYLGAMLLRCKLAWADIVPCFTS